MFEKYFDIQRADDGEVLFWWRAEKDGAPLKAPNIVNIVEGRTKLRPVIEAKVKVFDLSKEEDLDEYRLILDRARNGWYKIDYVERVFIPEKKNWLILLEWSERYVKPESE